METKYTKEYFIEKFEAIPFELYQTTELINPKNKQIRCAAGHCGMTKTDVHTPESLALGELLSPLSPKSSPYRVIYSINDGNLYKFSKLGSTPKERILNALKSLP